MAGLLILFALAAAVWALVYAWRGSLVLGFASLSYLFTLPAVGVESNHELDYHYTFLSLRNET
jgi:uncharacterized membrane protein YkgB